MAEDKSWIFVSHASADLPAVRKVRNYLEDRGAAPLLFHLRALKEPDEFWPLIEREIVERNFFLYCESANAESSKWVKRERETVAAAAHPKRIAHIRVDTPNLDFTVLNDFLAETRAFLCYYRADEERVRPYADALRAAGFGGVDWPDSLNEPWQTFLERQISETAQRGWMIVFLSNALAQRLDDPNASQFIEIDRAAQLGAPFVVVMLEKVSWPIRNDNLARLNWHPFFEKAEAGPDALVKFLLERKR